MKNLRYSTEDRSMIQAEDEAGNLLNVPADPANRDYAEILLRTKEGATAIADYVPDQAAVAGARRQKIAARMMELIADDANAGKTLDQIRAEAKALVAAQMQSASEKDARRG